MSLWQLPCGHLSNMPTCLLCAPTKAVSRRKPRRQYPRRRSGPAPTSSASLAVLSHRKTQQQYQAILDAIDENPAGLTRLELSKATGLPINVVTPRVHELLGRSPHAGIFRNDPVLAELHTPRRNKDTGNMAAVVVRAARLNELTGRLDI